MSDTFEFDERAARGIEIMYQTADVVAQRLLTHKMLELRAGEAVLDIGCGPGLLAHEMATTVGPAGRVCGIDLSADMVAMSMRRCADQEWTEFEEADAAALPYPDDTFDAAASTQVYEYVEDVLSVLVELRRVLRPGGRALIIDTDFDSLVLNSDDRELTTRILTAWDEHFVHRDLPRNLSALLREAGFAIRQRDTLPMFNPEYHRNAFGSHMVRIVANFAVGREGVTQEEADGWMAEQEKLGAEGRFFFSLNRYLFLAEKPG
jgi:ubiquinone/menaquinone biosynthesis C-methylase UbiE